MSRSLLALMVPEAERMVGDLRARLDPAAKLGLGAHLTLVYPFLDSEAIDADTVEHLRVIARAHPPPTFRLAAVGTFPSTVWLQPSPAEAIVALASALEAAFPDRPRNNQEFPVYVPHLSVARNVRRDCAAVVATLETRLRTCGPIDSTATHVHVMERVAGQWRTRIAIPLGEMP